jgi:hypothetical protein
MLVSYQPVFHSVSVVHDSCEEWGRYHTFPPVQLEGLMDTLYHYV